YHVKLRCLGEIILMIKTFGFLKGHILYLQWLHFLAPFNLTKIFFHKFLCFGFVKISRNYQGSIIRAVEFIVKLSYILYSGVLKIFEFSYHLPVIRMVLWEKVFVNHPVGVTIRVIVNPLALFILYYFLLIGKGRFGN